MYLFYTSADDHHPGEGGSGNNDDSANRYIHDYKVPDSLLAVNNFL
jgi:hypothetical protein